MKLRSADEHGPGTTPTPERALHQLTHGTSRLDLPPPPLPVSKHTRVWLEVWRSACAGISAVGTLLILARLFFGL